DHGEDRAEPRRGEGKGRRLGRVRGDDEHAVSAADTPLREPGGVGEAPVAKLGVGPRSRPAGQGGRQRRRLRPAVEQVVGEDGVRHASTSWSGRAKSSASASNDSKASGTISSGGTSTSSSVSRRSRTSTAAI